MDTVNPFTDERCPRPAAQRFKRDGGMPMELCTEHARLEAMVMDKYYAQVHYTLTPLTESDSNG